MKTNLKNNKTTKNSLFDSPSYSKWSILILLQTTKKKIKNQQKDTQFNRNSRNHIEI